MHQLNCTDNVLQELLNNFFLIKIDFVIRKSIILGYCKITTEELTFISTVLKSALICWFIYILWGKKKECKKGDGYFFLKERPKADFKLYKMFNSCKTRIGPGWGGI